MLRGFAQLTEAEQNELVSELNRYLPGDRATKESVRKGWYPMIDLGPSGGGGGKCPLCGR